MLQPGPRKVEPQNVFVKRTFIHVCTGRLREVEVRLDHGCSGRWLQQLDRCEGLSGLARLLLALQRRAHLQGLENGWLEELASSREDALEE